MLSKCCQQSKRKPRELHIPACLNEKCCSDVPSISQKSRVLAGRKAALSCVHSAGRQPASGATLPDATGAGLASDLSVSLCRARDLLWLLAPPLLTQLHAGTSPYKNIWKVTGSLLCKRNSCASVRRTEQAQNIQNQEQPNGCLQKNLPPSSELQLTGSTGKGCCLCAWPLLAEISCTNLSSSWFFTTL